MANSLTITGKFLGAGPIKQIGQNNRNIRSFWLDITDNIEYPNTPEFQLWGDKVYLPDNIQKGQLIEVKFNLNGRRYKNAQTGKEGIITNLDAWQINVIQTQSAASAPARPAATTSQSPTPMSGPGQYTHPTQPGQPATAAQSSGFPFAASEEDNNDLPF